MSILPMYRICPKCNRRYSFNPSVGKIFCPYCERSQFSGMGGKIIGKETPKGKKT